MKIFRKIYSIAEHDREDCFKNSAERSRSNKVPGESKTTSQLLEEDNNISCAQVID